MYCTVPAYRYGMMSEWMANAYCTGRWMDGSLRSLKLSCAGARVECFICWCGNDACAKDKAPKLGACVSMPAALMGGLGAFASLRRLGLVCCRVNVVRCAMVEKQKE